MGRLHTHNHGKAHSTRPSQVKVPSWINKDPKEVEELIIKYAKEDLTSSQIGIKTERPIFNSTCQTYHKKDNFSGFGRK